MNLDSLIKAQIDGGLIRQAWVMHMQTDPVVRAWTGIGSLRLEADSVDTEGGTYGGIGMMQDTPAIQSLVNGVAQRMDLTLSGVDQEILALVDGDAENVRSKQVDIGLLFMGEDWQPITTPLWVWQGQADFISTDSGSSPDFARTKSVTLSIGSITTGRRRARLSYFTKVQQRERSSTDAFCDFVSRYSADSEIKWPP